MRVKGLFVARHLDLHAAGADAAQFLDLRLHEVFVGCRQRRAELHLVRRRARRLRLRVERVSATNSTTVILPSLGSVEGNQSLWENC